MSSSASIRERIERIQAINNIRNLKFKYWNACDSKKPTDILECFYSEKIYINFEDFGIFASAKDMVKKYEFYSCHSHLIEQHAGKNPIIKLLSSNEASGYWSMSYSLIDTQKKISLNISGTYNDLYVRDKAKNWLIKETVFTKRASMYKSLTFDQCTNPRIAKSLGRKKAI
jgi:hypothetical protein